MFNCFKCNKLTLNIDTYPCCCDKCFIEKQNEILKEENVKLNQKNEILKKENKELTEDVQKYIKWVMESYGQTMDLKKENKKLKQENEKLIELLNLLPDFLQNKIDSLNQIGFMSTHNLVLNLREHIKKFQEELVRDAK